MCATDWKTIGSLTDLIGHYEIQGTEDAVLALAERIDELKLSRSSRLQRWQTKLMEEPERQEEYRARAKIRSQEYRDLRRQASGKTRQRTPTSHPDSTAE